MTALTPCTSLSAPKPLGPRLIHSSRLAAALPLRFARPLAPRRPIPWRSRPEASTVPLPQPPVEPSSTSEPFWRTAAATLGKAAALGALAAVLMLGAVSPADAARSGGRMGGSSGFSGRAASSYSSSSSGRSSSLGSSYSGTSRSYGGFSGSARGAGASSAGSPRVSVGASIMPSFFISPFGFGYGYGYPMLGGFNILALLFWGIFAAILLQVVQSVLRSGGSAGYLEDEAGYYDGKVTVAKLQVGLLASARELQQDLERIATRADTRSPAGLHFILQETVLALVRNPDYCVYGYSTGASMSSGERAETRFNEYSMEERGKFEAETLVNVGGRSARRSALKTTSRDGPQELIVVTILVAAEGAFKLPKITSRAELKAALSRLGALRADDVLAVEVLWTPEEEGDYFTVEDLAMDYPLLNTL